MWRNISIENGRGYFTEVSTQVLVGPPVWDSKTGGHVNEQFMDNQSLGAKRDKFMHRQTTVVAQFMRCRYAGRNVLAHEHCREWQILSRQLRFQTRIPRSMLCGQRFTNHSSPAGPGDHFKQI